MSIDAEIKEQLMERSGVADERLSKILDQYDQSRAALSERRKQAEAERLAAAEEGKSFVERELAPIINSYSEALEKRGHAARSEFDGSTATLHLFPKDVDRGGSTDRPFISFTVRPEKVEVSASNIVPGRGGSAGSRKSISRNEFSTEVVEQEILEWVDEVLNGAWH